MCDRAEDAGFTAAHALALTSADFLSTNLALSLLGVNGSVAVEGPVAMSAAAGWPAWPALGVIMGAGTTLSFSSRTGRGSIEFSMNADRLVTPGGSIRLDNLLLIDECMVNIPTVSQLPVYTTLLMYGGLDHPW